MCCAISLYRTHVNYVETFDRFRASSHCGRIPRQPRSKYAIEKKYNIAQGLIRDHCTAFLRYDHWSFLNVSST